MSSYQVPAPAGRWLTFTAAVRVSAATRDWLAGKITQRRKTIRLAQKAGWEYLLIDGVNVPTVAFAARPGGGPSYRSWTYPGRSRYPR